MNHEYNLCGCGRSIRYMTPNGDACNKYSRCPTYEELRNSLGNVNSKLLNLLAIIHRDGGHYTFEVGLEQSVDLAEQVLWRWRGAYDTLGSDN